MRRNFTARTLVTAWCLCALFWFGCAAKVYKHHLVETQESAPSAEVYFLNAAYRAAIAMPILVYLNDEKLIRLRGATYARIRLKPGTYGVRFGESTRGQHTEGVALTSTMSFDAGKTYFVQDTVTQEREFATLKYVFHPVLITEEGAKSVLPELTEISGPAE